MNEHSEHDLNEAMRQALRLIGNIEKTKRWRLDKDEVNGWQFEDGRGGRFYFAGEHGLDEDGRKEAPRSRADMQRQTDEYFDALRRGEH